MSFFIDIVIFGVVVTENIELEEIRISFIAIMLGLLLKLIMTNLSTKKDGMSTLDVFFGTGFSDLSKAEFAYITNPLKKLIKIQGPYAELIISITIASIFPQIGPELVDIASLKEYLFLAITIGYSASVFLIHFSEMINNFIAARKVLSEMVELVDTILEEDI